MNFLLQDKHVLVLGLGMTGQACVRFAKSHAAKVVGIDTRTDLNLELDVPVQLGEFDQQQLLNADLLVVSPGVDLRQPAIQTALKAGVEVMGDVELFAKFNRIPCIGITGSNGKSTVTALLTEMLRADGRKAEMGGNIGTPALQLLEKNADLFVLELSSFQLETVSSLQLEAACILNISADHLDRHGNFENYQLAKQRIYDHAKHRVCNRDDFATLPLDKKVTAEIGLSPSVLGCGWHASTRMIQWQGQDYFDFAESPLLGEHNVYNLQAAIVLAKLVGAADTAIKSVAKTFSGLPHRCQVVAKIDDVSWINDSKATNVGATLAAIDGLAADYSKRIILIAGGDGKNADFAPLAEAFSDHLKVLITLGKDAELLNGLFNHARPVDDLQQAVTLASELADPGDSVLLSPACASLDMFDDFQHRGECFIQAVEALKK